MPDYDSYATAASRHKNDLRRQFASRPDLALETWQRLAGVAITVEPPSLERAALEAAAERLGIAIQWTDHERKQLNEW